MKRCIKIYSRNTETTFRIDTYTSVRLVYTLLILLLKVLAVLRACVAVGCAYSLLGPLLPTSAQSFVVHQCAVDPKLSVTHCKGMHIFRILNLTQSHCLHACSLFIHCGVVSECIKRLAIAARFLLACVLRELVILLHLFLVSISASLHVHDVRFINFSDDKQLESLKGAWQPPPLLKTWTSPCAQKD